MHNTDRCRSSLFGAALFAALSVAASICSAQNDKASFALPNEMPAPLDNQSTPERVDLGKMLFFDPRLSASSRMSCATCHDPLKAWSDGLPVRVGDDVHILKRATPSIVNIGFNSFQMWDGRFRTLEDQAWEPMLASTEMHGLQSEVLAKLQAMPGYVNAFNKAYAGEGISKITVAKAIASFERTVISRDSPFDLWIAGNEFAISDSAKRGFTVFVGKANCIACHQGGNFTDQGFHNIGLANDSDPGRFAVVPVRVSRGAFKTPGLRDVAEARPYMHNGAYSTLEEVINHYDRGGDNKDNLDPNMKPLGLTSQEKQDLVEFLKSLTGQHAAVTLPALPEQP